MKRACERRTLVSFRALPEGARSLSGVAGASPSSSRLPPLPTAQPALTRPSISRPLRPQAPSCSPTTLRALQYSHPDPAIHPLKTPSTSPSPSPSLHSPLPPRLLPDLRPGQTQRRLHRRALLSPSPAPFFTPPPPSPLPILPPPLPPSTPSTPIQGGPSPHRIRAPVASLHLVLLRGVEGGHRQKGLPGQDPARAHGVFPLLLPPALPPALPHVLVV
jgi:hypothetical protein